MNLIPVSKIVSERFSRIFIVSVALQLVCLSIIMGMLSYSDAKRRANFLANSNGNSLGLMMSTGDFFQVKNVVKSFRGEATPIVGIFNELNENALSDMDQSQTKFPKTFPSMHFQDGVFLLFTNHPIRYNGIDLGTLVLANRLFIRDWVLTCALLLLFAIATFYFQGRYLKNLTLYLGKNIVDLGGFFEASETEENVDKVFRERAKSSILEVESLASNIYTAIIEQIRSSDLEREAAVGRITAHLSHDLRGPLGAFEKLLLSRDNELPQLRDSVRDSLNRIYSMIDALRHSETENLITRSTEDMTFRFGQEFLTAKAQIRRIELRTPNIELKRISIDHTKVERSWINLASNAIDFANSHVSVEAEVSGTDLIMRVIDDGPGVPDEFLPRLFQRGATHGKADGTGLGLAYVRQIMRGHGGDASYRREKGLTIFECRLPNAVESERDQVVENTSAFQLQLKQNMVNSVAICLVPEQLSTAVLAKLASLNSEDFFFIDERSEANFVVSNIEDVMFETLERDDQEFVSVTLFHGDEAGIIELLKKKFDLD